MKLRRQLLLVSLLTLALPWAGCEYVREMESTLRQGQAAALQATARAVAARLASDPETRQLISGSTPGTSSERLPIYAHALASVPFVDGYNDDWRNLGLEEQVLSAGDDQFQARVMAGKASDELFIFCRIADTSLRYYSPQRALTDADHLQLWLQPPGQAAATFSVYTAAPGKVTVVTAHGNREHRISGVWQERQGGYQLELRIPLAWAESQLGLVFNDASATTGHRSARNFAAGTSPPPVVSLHPALSAALAVFTETGDGEVNTGTVLRLATPNAWVIAEAGERRATPAAPEQNRLITRLYRLALGEQAFPPLVDPHSTGQLASPEVASALAGGSAVHWYRDQKQQVARAAAPVRVAGIPIAAVVAEQGTDTLQAMTDSAFSRLVSYSLVAAAVAGLGLLAYASWLSWRIRRLSRAAEQAVDDSGRINQSFSRSRSADEIGELSRRYGELLERLRQYNTYLETLASKLSHELRTPLAVVRSSLDNLEHEPLPPQAGIYRERAREGAERLSKILNAMSAASRVEQSIRAAELEPVDLQTLLRDLTSAYADIYPKVNWQFIAAEGDFRLRAAPDLLVQMLDKLADNAADFCPTGQTVSLSLEKQGHYRVLRVHNPGPPLPRQMRGQLFDSLVSVREGATQGEHLGLGLYIARLIADFHGGSVEADNGPDGTGAVFSVRLPAGQ